jgi:hypothetical protein
MFMILFRGLQLCVSLIGLSFNVVGLRAWRKKADALVVRNMFHGPERIIVIEMYDQELMRCVLQSIMVLLGVVGIFFKPQELPAICQAFTNTPASNALAIFYRAMFMVISILLSMKAIFGYIMRTALEEELNDRIASEVVGSGAPDTSSNR